MRRCFISYSHRDSEFVNRLHDHLESTLRVWIDRRKMQPGISLPTQMAAAVGSATYLLPVISRQSARSKWVRDEISLARVEKLSVIPLRLDHAPLPPEIKHLLYVDFTSRRFEDGLSELVGIIERDLLVKGRLKLKQLSRSGASRVRFLDEFTAVVSTVKADFASVCLTLDDPLFIIGLSSIHVHVSNSAACEFTGYSEAYPKMLKVEMDETPVEASRRTDRVEDDSSFVKPRDGYFSFAIPARICQLGHLSKLNIVIGKARLREFKIQVVLD